jgi:ketosteroid isomerase-like protein
VTEKDSAAELERAIDRYNQAWNDQDLETIVAMHAPDMVFENHSAGERAEGDAVRSHIAEIFRNWPDLRMVRRRRLGVTIHAGSPQNRPIYEMDRSRS